MSYEKNKLSNPSPFEVLYGQKPCFVGVSDYGADIEMKTMYASLIREMVRRRNLLRVSSQIVPTVPFAVGNVVLLSRPQKLHKLEVNWAGPFIITDVYPNFTYRLKNLTGKKFKKIFNHDRLKLFKFKTFVGAPPALEEESVK